MTITDALTLAMKTQGHGKVRSDLLSVSLRFHRQCQGVRDGHCRSSTSRRLRSMASALWRATISVSTHARSEMFISSGCRWNSSRETINRRA